jgi:hypothetical protein
LNVFGNKNKQFAKSLEELLNATSNAKVGLEGTPSGDQIDQLSQAILDLNLSYSGGAKHLLPDFLAFYAARDGLDGKAREALGESAAQIDRVAPLSKEEADQFWRAYVASRNKAGELDRAYLELGLEPQIRHWLSQESEALQAYVSIPEGFEPELTLFRIGEPGFVAGTEPPSKVSAAIDAVVNKSATELDRRIFDEFSNLIGSTLRGMFSASRSFDHHWHTRRRMRLHGLTASNDRYPILTVSTERRQIAMRGWNSAFTDAAAASGFAWEVMPFHSLLEASLIVDDETVASTSGSRSIGGAILGGLVFGPAGAIVGGLGRKTETTSTSRINKITLRLRLSALAEPVRDIPLAAYSTGVEVDAAQSDLKHAETWLARMKSIVDSREPSAPAYVGPAVPEAMQSSPTTVAAQVWITIAESMDVNDYADFLAAFSGTPEAMLAVRHRRQLEHWASTAKTDPQSVREFLATSPFPRLAAEARALLNSHQLDQG